MHVLQIHYGYASLAPVTRTPALCVLPKEHLDPQQLAEAASLAMAQITAASGVSGATAPPNSSSSNDISTSSTDNGGDGGVQAALVLVDQGYHHLLPELREAMVQLHCGPLQLLFAEPVPTCLDPPGYSSSTTSSSIARGRGSCGSGACATALPHGEAAEPAACDGDRAAGLDCCSQPDACCSSAAPAHAAAAADAQSPSPQFAAGASGPTVQGPAPVPAAAAGAQAIGGLTWRLPPGISPKQLLMLWVGPPHAPALTQLQLTHSTRAWRLVDPATGAVGEGLSLELARLLKRRWGSFHPKPFQPVGSIALVGCVGCRQGAGGTGSARGRVCTVTDASASPMQHPRCRCLCPSRPLLPHCEYECAQDTAASAPSCCTACDPICQAHAPCIGRTPPPSPRYYLVEKAREASIVGVLVGTLGAAGYQGALQQLRRLARQVRAGGFGGSGAGAGEVWK